MFGKNWPEEEPKDACTCSQYSMCRNCYDKRFAQVAWTTSTNYVNITASTAATTYGELTRSEEVWWRSRG